MIITRTPLRVTLGGGGTDLPSYYRAHGGFIFAMGIDQYVHVMVSRPALDDRVRVRHATDEVVATVAELEHELARTTLERHGIRDRVALASMADLPEGTGLGSSGSYLAGLLAALHQLGGSTVAPQELAEEACHIEMELLRRPVGKQDPYMAVFGGLTVLEIAPDGAVTVRPAEVGESAAEALVARTHLYYTGVRRSAATVLRDQDRAMAADGADRANGADGPEAADGAGHRRVAESLHRIRDLGHRILEAIEAEDLDGWGRLLHEHWEHKKRLSSRISLGAVDSVYEHVRAEYGVLGGKIAGAGGGGFLMLYCEGEGERLERFMASRGMPRLRYSVARAGTRVIADARAGALAAALPQPA